MNKLKKAPARSQFTILRQICNFIPRHLVSKMARATGAEDKSRTFKPWSHVVSLLYGQLTHSIGLNDLCDSQATVLRTAVERARSDGSQPQRALQRQPGASARDGRAALLAGDGSLGPTIARLCQGAEPRAGLSLLDAHRGNQLWHRSSSARTRRAQRISVPGRTISRRWSTRSSGAWPV